MGHFEGLKHVLHERPQDSDTSDEIRLPLKRMKDIIALNIEAIGRI